MNFHPLHGIWNTQFADSLQPQAIGMVTRVHTMDGGQPKRAKARKVAAPRRPPMDDFVTALGHGIALLECWNGSETWLSNSDLAARSGLTKPTVSRLTSVLVDLGYISRERQRGRKRLTIATLELGFGSAFASEPIADLHGELDRLAKDLDVYAALGIRRVDKVQVLDNVASPLHPDAVPMDVGGLLPMCRSASGLAAFSALPQDEAVPLLQRLRSHYGSRWEPLQGQLMRTKLEYADKGYCTSVAGLSSTVAAVAVPVVPSGSGDIFVIGCGMPAAEYHRERVEKEIVPEMLRVVRRLQTYLAS